MAKAGRKPKVTVAQCLTAIEGSGAIVSSVCKRLNISWGTFDLLRKRHESIRVAMNDEAERLMDFAESKLIEAIRKGNIIATIFYLKCKGKSRGYIERQEVTGANGEPTTIKLIWPEDEDSDARAANLEVASAPVEKMAQCVGGDIAQPSTE